MKNQIITMVGQPIMNGLINGMKGLADFGLRATLSIPDQFGNVIKITLCKKPQFHYSFFRKIGLT